jgi:hypothetical protein
VPSRRAAALKPPASATATISTRPSRGFSMAPD